MKELTIFSFLNNSKIKQLIPILVFLTFIPSQSYAHSYGGATSGFATGFFHPLGGLDHFLAMFAVGLWGAQIGGRSVWTLPVTFPLIMVIGGFLGITKILLPGVEIGISLSMLALGAAIAMNWKSSEIIMIALVSIFAIYHGYAHGLELPKATKPADYAIGFVVSTGLIHILGIGIGMLSQKFYSGKSTRILGGVVILGGVYFLTMAI